MVIASFGALVLTIYGHVEDAQAKPKTNAANSFRAPVRLHLTQELKLQSQLTLFLELRNVFISESFGHATVA